MSGGVDSAVALLRAGPDAVGVTLRLWLDPEGPDAERACCSPEAVLAARETCHGLGLPHVTLDLREEFRRAVVEPFVRGYARGETPNPCTRCNGGFRFAELLAFARRAGAARLATGHYARIVEHRGRRLLARAADAAKDQSYMLARLDPRRLDRIWFPLGDQTKDGDARGGRGARGSPSRGARESQEACFLAGGDYRAFLERHGLAVARRADRRRGRAASSAGTTATGASRRASAAASASSPREPLYALGTDAAREHRRRRAARGARPHAAFARAAGSTSPVERVEAKLRYRSPAAAARVVADRARLPRSSSTSPPTASRRGQAAVLYEGDAVVGSGLITSARAASAP